jgi:hypothetical protein
MTRTAARANVVEAIGAVDWGNKTLSVRINGLDSPYWYRDVVDLLEQGGERLDHHDPEGRECVGHLCRRCAGDVDRGRHGPDRRRSVSRSSSKVPPASPMSRKSPPPARACKP